ncbi:MAG TPA: hypothetical protein VEI02_00765, partial [Planctomycetota bacterium]|nr:hypothetical protein [Planctomycetota bacterium]
SKRTAPRTVPAAGCSDVDAYYAMASAHHVADRIARPTLILAALDDPLAPAAPVREVYGAHARVDLRMTTHGSHLAFLERRNGTWRSGFAERLLDGLEGLRAT